MKIGIVHFTDIHYTSKTDLTSKLASCINALKNDFYGMAEVFFILSGDITFSGKAVEYKLAKGFFSQLKMLLQMQYSAIKVNVIIVPGNHDCNVLEKETQIRTNSIKNLNYGYLGTDNSVIDVCLAVQDEFWEFYGQYQTIPEDKLFYQLIYKIGDHSICFHCINTGWASQKREQVGSIFFPVKRYDSVQNEEHSLDIGVWHHPYNWFNPSTAENNKREFEHFTERLAPVHFLGHEHEQDYQSKKNMETGHKLNLLSGKIFNDDEQPDISGFQTIVVDLQTRIGQRKPYTWNKEKSIYDAQPIIEVSFYKNSTKKFEIKPDFIKSLDEIKIPLNVDGRKLVRLSEIYVFPDLDTVNSESKILDNYSDSENLLSDVNGHSIIEGDNQIGKSSLMNIITLRNYDKGKYPLLLSGSDIKELDLTKTLRRAFRKQYIDGDANFEEYLQLEKSKKILLIDDYHDCAFNIASTYNMLKEAMVKFDKVLLTIDVTHSLLPIMQTEFKDIGFYKIKPLGYHKRNSLIEKYHSLKESNHIDQDNLNEIKESFDKVSAVLGDKLIPSYPIFVLSILQALEYNSLQQNETSFGYCYQTLIHYSLHKAMVKNEDVDTYFNILIELAYELIIKDKDVISEVELLNFFTDYKKKYLAPSYDKVISTLKASKILVFEDDIIRFGYPYILYYLSAKKIADIIHTVEGKSIVSELFKNMANEKNGHVLVFVTHHSKDISFIEESLLNSMIILDNFPPITLSTTDPFYDHVKEIANDVSKDILEINKNPKMEREKLLKELDQQSSENINLEMYEDKELIDGINAIMLPFKLAFRSIEIVGQIIKNRKGSLTIEKLKEMIKEVYTTGFRTISYSSQLLLAAKNQIILKLNEDDDLVEASKSEIEQNVKDFVMMSSYETCLGVFGKLADAMGIKDLKDIFINAADEIDTPAAKLVSFTINSYYGSISENDLRTITNYLKGNPVALKILRSRVKSYVYGRNLNIRTKQKFASLLNMSLGPSVPKSFS